MSDILDFIIKNFGRLRPADYFVLAIFGALVAGAVFVALRRFFSSRFQAQNELLDLQAKTVNALNSHLELTQRERDDLQKKLEEKMRRLTEMERLTAMSDNEKDAVREEALVIIGSGLVAYQHRVGLAYHMLFLYQLVSDESVPADTISILQHFSDKVDAIRELYEKTASQKHRDSLNDLASLTYSSDTIESANRVFIRFDALGDEINAKAHSLKKIG
jgi:acyl-CoA synthetase (AMP-forming)/AMP-acid ligase II